MILSDTNRRWAEVRFYYFCYDIFTYTKNMVDVVYVIETISQIGKFNLKEIKNIAGKMLGDPYYLPHRNELIILGYKMGVKKKILAEITGKTKQSVYQTIKLHENEVNTYLPRLQIDEDQQIVNFLNLVDIIQKVGIPNVID